MKRFGTLGVGLLLASWILGGGAVGTELSVERTDTSRKISESEWLSYIATDQSLSLIQFLEATNPSTGEVIRINAPNAGKWSDPISKSDVIFMYSRGRIKVRASGHSVEAKLQAIARALEAEVKDDEGNAVF